MHFDLKPVVPFTVVTASGSRYSVVPVGDQYIVNRRSDHEPIGGTGWESGTAQAFDHIEIQPRNGGLALRFVNDFDARRTVLTTPVVAVFENVRQVQHA